MKNIAALLSLIFVLSIAKGQKAQNIYFLKNDGKEAKSKDSADFIRVIEEPDSGDTRFILKEVYTDGKKMRLGYLSSFMPKLVFEGAVMTYFKNGKRKNVATYQKGNLVGMEYDYFEDGQLNMQQEHGLPALNKSNLAGNALVNSDVKLIYYADSIGNAYIKDGNGKVEFHTKSENDELIEEGNYKNGYKDGVWKGRHMIAAKTYVETYAESKLISGESNVDGKTYTYTTTFEPPKFKGGLSAWSQYIGNETAYPAQAAENNITGTVLTQFVIDKEGKIVEINLTQAVHPILDNEAKRVLLKSPRWIPGKSRGVPVRVKYTQPFKFSFH